MSLHLTQKWKSSGLPGASAAVSRPRFKVTVVAAPRPFSSEEVSLVHSIPKLQ